MNIVLLPLLFEPRNLTSKATASSSLPPPPPTPPPPPPPLLTWKPMPRTSHSLPAEKQKPQLRRRGSRGERRQNRDRAWRVCSGRQVMQVGWGGGKEEEKGKGDGDEELPPREGTPPIRTVSPFGSIVGPVHPTADLSSRSSTPTPTPNANTTTTSSSATPLPPLNSDHILSALPETAEFDLAAIKAELAGLESKVGKISTTTMTMSTMAGGMGMVDNEESEQEEHRPTLSSFSSFSLPLPPTPSSKSPNAAYISFHRDESGGGTPTSTLASASSYNNNNNTPSLVLGILIL
ncbi:hypothetical protein F5876DRAFT_82100 [Lentinula aff. lateritia]|uniref:Uncharacterized protein n=1 Tax=Lentinula aff. lateritia TaxID=2804960 RepID=A0ACC1TKA1_9AGAR|nr:hypothetical protein F5876DRAFT_82100 [Lentinula aff. lateritia]